MKSKGIDKIKSAKAINVGGPAIDSTASLCIYGKDIDLNAITFKVGIRPTSGVRRGEVIGSRRPPKVGHWFLEAPSELSFEEKIQYLLRSTTNNHSIWAALAADHDIQLRCVIYLHSWSEGFDLPAAVVAEIGNRHWQFGLAMYSAEGEEIVDAFLSDELKKKANDKAQQKNRADSG
ncbi:MAG: DUF4279 domain-containing protein [Syntrophaceae bacterium]|nr:DUF4279 domain-containing protein [Syntrophaceae bacterium]